MMKCETGKSNDIRALLVLRLAALAYLKRRTAASWWSFRRGQRLASAAGTLALSLRPRIQ